MRFHKEKTIETPYGETELKMVGNGPPVLVIHGGPGFSHQYLLDSLLPLSEKRTLIFYDQPSFDNPGKQDEGISPFIIFSHFRWLASKLSENEAVGLIAHSWGSLVVIAGLIEPKLKTAQAPNLSKILLMNPMPVSSQDLKQSQKILMKRLSKFTVIKLLYLIVSNADGNRIMKELLPTYVYDEACIPRGDFALDRKTYLKLTQQLKSYDFADELKALPEISLLLSENDFIKKAHLEPLITSSKNIFTIKNSVHFPMWENPAEFHETLSSMFVED